MMDGWRCPVCGRGVSPLISVCDCANAQKHTTKPEPKLVCNNKFCFCTGRCQMTTKEYEAKLEREKNVGNTYSTTCVATEYGLIK